mmetsp:Transcript_1787/g.5227  ORF Transcript_1787/g.5227 Transcript_1787/m.5227 type:complete len:95 (-) Transcript_1787:1437-1721(-)
MHIKDIYRANEVRAPLHQKWHPPIAQVLPAEFSMPGSHICDFSNIPASIMISRYMRSTMQRQSKILSINKGSKFCTSTSPIWYDLFVRPTATVL